jgi:sugar-specific transcriptional regulator TrmB
LPREKNIQTLMGLGFTSNQAKVYLALVDREFSTVKEVQKISEVPRQEIYKILYILQEMGFLERTLTKPVMFKATPLQQVVSFLLKRKIQETKKLQKEVEEMMESYCHEIHNLKVQEFKPHFVLISKKEASISKRQEDIDNAQTSIDFITSWKRFPRTVHTFKENVKKALEKNVKMRVILEKPKDLHEIPEKIDNYKKFPNYQLRYILHPPKAIIGIFDKKKAIIKTSASVGLTESPSLWTDNACLLSVFSDYFEIMWITAIEKIHEGFIKLV